MNMLHLVVASLRRRPLRVALTVLTVAVAFVLYAYLSAIHRGFEMGADVAGTNRLVVRSPIGIKLLPLRYEERIEEIEGVVEATPITFFGGKYGDRDLLFSQFPLWPDEFRRVYPEFTISDDELARWKATRTGAIVGRVTAERFGLEPGDRFPLGSRLWQTKDGEVWDFEIVGIYEGAGKGTDESLMFFRQDYFDEKRLIRAGFILFFIVIVDDPSRSAETAGAIDAGFRNSEAETKTEPEAAFLNSLASQIGDVGAIVVGIMSAVFFTMLLVVGNTMMQSVRERTVELGLLKALGFSDTRIAALVLSESLLLSIIGGASGLLLGALSIGQGDPTGGLLPAFYLEPSAVGTGFLLILALGTSTGAVPVFYALRMDPVAALQRD